MFGDDSVTIAGFLRILKIHGVEVSVEADGRYIFSKGEIIEAQFLGKRVGRRMLHRFRAKFEIPIQELFHADDPPAGPRLVERKVPGIKGGED